MISIIKNAGNILSNQYTLKRCFLVDGKYYQVNRRINSRGVQTTYWTVEVNEPEDANKIYDLEKENKLYNTNQTAY